MQELFPKQKGYKKSHLFTYETAFPDIHVMSRKAKAWKFMSTLLQNEETYRAKYL